MVDGPGAAVQPSTRCRRRLIIMVKDPVAGRVKTRLAREIGSARATAFYRATVSAVTARLAHDPRWLTELAVAPATATASRLLPRLPARRFAQSQGDIGHKMQAILDRPHVGPMVVIGTDIPSVSPCHIEQAFHALGDHDVVFGPALDGGFWLIGMRRTPRVIDAFAGGVRWSTEHTLADCMAGLAGRRVAAVAMLRDTDDAADLKAVRNIAGRRVPPR